MIYDRKATLTIGESLYKSEEFDLDFKVEFDSEPEPEVQEISIYNLSTNSQNQILKGSNVILNAGYANDTGAIVVGNISDYRLIITGVDHEMKLFVVSNLERWSTLTITKTYRAGIRASQIIKDILGTFGVEIGQFNLVNDITYSNGRSVSGMLKNVLQEIVRECQSNLYIINNIIYIREPYQGMVTGFVLSGETGMIGSPERIEIDGKEGYKVRMLLNHRINVNSVIEIRSKVIKGNFIVVKGKHQGNWITDVEVLPL